MDFTEDFNQTRLPNTQSPPPLPPRQSQTSFSSYGNYGNQGMYSSYNSWRPNSYGVSSYGVGGYPSYGAGYPQYGQPYGVGEGYAGPAIGGQFEAASRPAFEMIESVVYTVGSVSQLLDSSYNAVLASFRSVLAVLEQFSRMKNQFSTLFSAFAMIRMIRWLKNKILNLAALATGQPRLQTEAAENIWSSSFPPSTVVATNKEPGPFKWPLFIYLAFVFGAPYLTWKLVSSDDSEIPEDVKKSEGWKTGEEDHFVARAVFDFAPHSSDELGFRNGETLIVAPKERQPKIRGWILASVDGLKSGLVPVNRVKILGKRSGSRTSTVKIAPDVVESSTNLLEDAFK